MTSTSGDKRENSKIRLIWHRRDLRLNDNELYSDLCGNGKNGSEVVPSVSLYVFDSKYFEPQTSLARTPQDFYQTVWCGPHAAQALIEAVESLRESIRSIGGELLVRTGDPSNVVPQIAEEIGATEIIYNEEPGWYENIVAQKLKQRYAFQDGCGERKVKLISKNGYTLYHPNDLPTDPDEWNRLAHPKKTKKKKNNKSPHSSSNSRWHSNDYVCDYLDLVDISPNRFKGICRIMGDFRRAAKSAASVRPSIDAPPVLTKPKSFDASSLKGKEGSLPVLEDLMKPLLAAPQETILGLKKDTINFIVQSAILNREQKRVDGRESFGENAALQRLNHFIDGGYAEIADRSKADVSDNNSSRFSVHLALGTISPRLIYWKAHDAGDASKWLISHLEMRDFFLYTTFATGDRIFRIDGLPLSKKQEKVIWRAPYAEKERWCRWATGKTQLPMVDATMLELMSTGYASNRVRQNVASVLTKDLQIDWRAGAEWFQFLLEDHCVGANFGNWLYFSGVGPDPKNRHFRTVSQLKRYDPNGGYVKKWLPVLKDKDGEAVLRPWDYEIEEFSSPIVDPETQFTWQDLQCLNENGTLFPL